MADIQPATAEIRRGEKEEEERRRNQGINLMVCPIAYRATIVTGQNITVCPIP